jgi:hypothetical protein
MPLAKAVKAPGTTSISEMLPPKAAQVEGMRVEYDGLRSVSDPVSIAQPAVAQLAVL